MPPEKRRPQPGGNGRGPLEIIAAGSGDGSDHSLEIPVSQLRHRPIGPGERDREKRDKIAVRSTVWKAVHAGADTLGKIRKTTDLSDPLIKSALRFHVKERAVLKNGKRYSTIGSESRS